MTDSDSVNWPQKPVNTCVYGHASASLRGSGYNMLIGPLFDCGELAGGS